MMETNSCVPRQVRVTITINETAKDAISCASSINEDDNLWRIVIAKEQADRFGLIPVLAHELGHLVSVVARDSKVMKDSRLNRLVPLKDTSIVSGTAIYRSEERAWEIGEMIAFRRARSVTLRTYNFMVGKLVTLLSYVIMGAEGEENKYCGVVYDLLGNEHFHHPN